MNRHDEAPPIQQLREHSDVRPASQRAGCVVFGHDYTFRADGVAMRWDCRRGCGAGGSKTYPSALDATRFAQAFDRRDSAEVGRRAPLIGLLPLRLWRHFQGRKTRDAS
ncbi:MAG: hypothetical protein L0H96_02330 [Humibacillus sp.]|nr:hypothetical protein [Humibacillus sp.]MDN5775729.1 hypothetical protein [Humibacillus sp.]